MVAAELPGIVSHPLHSGSILPEKVSAFADTADRSPDMATEHQNARNSTRGGIPSLLLSIIMLAKPFLASAQGVQPQGLVKEPQKAQQPIENGVVDEFFMAILSNNLDKVKELIEQGVNVNVQHDKGYTPLLYAIEQGHKEVAEFLIGSDADINGKDQQGYTPLYYAIWNKDADMVNFLVDKGADVNVLPHMDGTPLEYAVWRKNMEMAKLLVARGAKIDLKDNNGWTAFRYAISQANRDMVEFFVSRGADVSTFHLAACAGDLDLVKSFMQQGTGVDTKDEMGWTALYCAVSAGQEEVAEYLIVKGAVVNAKTGDGSTPLHQAVQRRSVKLVELLIAKGADVNVKARDNRTPLHQASIGGYRDIVEILIAKGADVNMKDSLGRTPLDLAGQKNYIEIVELLLSNKADTSAALLSAIQSGDRRFVEQLLDRGANVNTQGKWGQSLLHMAVKNGQNDLTQLLLAYGADIEAKDNAGRTPLHYAVGASHIVQLLLNKGANINITDRWGWTPLHYATRNRYKSTVEVLMYGGADPNITDERGRTALSVARDMESHYRALPSEREMVAFYRDIAGFLRQYKSAYFVAPDGKNSNPGSLEHPFRTITAGISIAEAGDIICVRGGVYNCTSKIHIDKSGEQGRPICLRAYPGETPVFDFSTAQGDGLSIRGAYWHLKGLAVTGAAQWGIRMEYKESCHNILEQVSTYANGLAGVAVENGAAYNIILNCDSYRNFDPETNGEHADGFNAGRRLGKGNVFMGCRAWDNSDDGFDFVYAGEGVGVETCYVFRNGENIWQHPFFQGNGNGFKLGNGDVRHIVIGCLAWEHRFSGFNLVSRVSSGGVNLHNCIAFNNFRNYYFPSDLEGSKFSIFRNSISYKGKRSDSFVHGVDSQQNSWDAGLGITLTDGDFVSLDDSMMSSPRNADGSIPQNNFLQLSPGSAAIDKGADIGMPFVGSRPDLGAFEYDSNASSQGYVKMLHQAVRDRDIAKIRELLAQGEDINDKDWLGYTPIQWAVYFGYPDVVELLISQGADPDIQSDTGRFTLEIAKAMVYADIEALLNKHKAIKDAPDISEGTSPEAQSHEKQTMERGTAIQ